MPPKTPIWKTKARSLQKAGKDFREKSPEGIHDLRVALRRVSATASALGRGGIAKKSKKLGKSLSVLRQLEVDRKLLARVRELGWLPDEVAAGIDAHWDGLIRQSAKTAARRIPTEEIDRLRRKLSRLSRQKQEDLLVRLEAAQKRVERDLAAVAGDAKDRALHQYRLAVKESRYLTEDLALAGRPGLAREIARKKKIQDALGRWNDLRLFRRDLAATRDDAERRGAVTFVLELDRLVTALEPAVSSARQEALRVVRSTEPDRRRRPAGAAAPASDA